jgi:hypothetical protein
MDGHIHIKPNKGYHIIPRHLVWRGIKPSAELEINVDVKYVGEDERTDGKRESWHGLGEMGKR